MQRPIVTLKLATSLDGKIALANGMSQWITGGESRRAGRLLRAENDGIAVGSNTAFLDNPQLTTRIGDRPDPARIIFDSRVRLPRDSYLAQTAKNTPVWVLCKRDYAKGEKAADLRGLGVKILPVDSSSEGLDALEAMNVLRQRQIQKLLVEGGGQLAASMLSAGLVDIIEWFRAPIILGGDGRSAIGPLGLEALKDARAFRRVSICELGDDIHERYERI